MTGYLERLRRLSINDRRYLETIMGGSATADPTPGETTLDPRTSALARVAVLVAMDGPEAAFDCAVAGALAAGATADEIVDVLVAVGPTVGSAHLVSAAPKVALGLGHDVAGDLERLDPPPVTPAVGAKSSIPVRS